MSFEVKLKEYIGIETPQHLKYTIQCLAFHFIPLDSLIVHPLLSISAFDTKVSRMTQVEEIGIRKASDDIHSSDDFGRISPVF